MRGGLLGTVVLLALALALVAAPTIACNKSGEFADCGFEPDPTAGQHGARCPESIFQIGETPWRDLNGVIWRGDNGVAGAVIVVDTHAGVPTQTISGANGFFGPVKDAAVRYDLTSRIDRDVLAVHGLTTRYPAPSIDLPTRSLAAGWVKRVNIQLERSLPGGHTLAFFATGGNAYGVVGDLEQGVSVVDKDYAGNVTIHAVEYEKDKDLGTAVAYGKADAFVSAASPQLVPIHLDPIATFSETMVTATVPSGMSATEAEIVINFSRSSGARVTTLPLGEKRKLPVIPNVGSYAYRIHASSSDGAASDSGEQFLDVFAAETKAELVAPPIVDQPADGAAITIGDALAAHGPGVLEHVLTGGAGPSSIHLVAMDQRAALPSFAAVGAEVPRGRWTWVVRSYPKLKSVDELGGQDARRYDPRGTSAPRTIVFPD